MLWIVNYTHVSTKMFIEIKYTCHVWNSGYAFDENGWVRPIDKNQDYQTKPLDEIAVFELTDLFGYLDRDYETGLPSRLEQSEILRFYNRWGSLGMEWIGKPNIDAEPASVQLRALKDFWHTQVFAPFSINIIHHDADNEIWGQPKSLFDALVLIKSRLDKSSYTTCEYFNIYGEPRGRRGLNSGTCPPKCRVKKQPITKFNPNGNSWGKGCQKVHDNKRRRANEKGEQERSKK